MPRKIEIYSDIVLFGIRVVFESDRQDALDSINTAYALWNKRNSMDDRAPIIYVVIKPNNSNEAARVDHLCVQGTNLDIARDGICITADGKAGRGRCVFPLEAAGSEAFLDAINTIVLFLIAHAGRIPLHASAVMLGDTAIVFAGRGGSGKSMLALAASRAGLPVLSEDTIFIQTVPCFRIWSLMRAIHVFEKDAPAGVEAGMRFRSGRWKKALAVVRSPHVAEHGILCVLARGERILLEPIGRTQAVAEIVADPEPGFEFYGERSVAAAHALAKSGAWRLSLSKDPAEAIDLVRCTFASFSTAKTSQAQKATK